MCAHARIVFLFAFTLLTARVWSTDKKEEVIPEALLSRARMQQQIWTGGTPPMQMRADIQFADAKGALVQGDYILSWVSPSKWREEIRLGNYERLRVGDAKGYWQKSGLSYQPEIIFQLDTLLHLKDLLRVGSKQTLGKVKDRKRDGVPQKCTEVKWARGTDRTICFDGASGSLVSVDYPTGQNQNPLEISRIEYSTFKSVNGKLIPYEIRALQGRKVTVTVRVLEIVETGGQNPELFNAPPNAEFWVKCDDMQNEELADRVQPIYPASSRANREQGRVILYAVVEADGSLSHMTIIQRATPNLEAAAVEAVRQWHYKPAACGQTPTRVERSIEVDFWLKY